VWSRGTSLVPRAWSPKSNNWNWNWRFRLESASWSWCEKRETRVMNHSRSHLAPQASYSILSAVRSPSPFHSRIIPAARKILRKRPPHRHREMRSTLQTGHVSPARRLRTSLRSSTRYPFRFHHGAQDSSSAALRSNQRTID
jgi:hypothetical protein